MEKQSLRIKDVPVIIWGEASEQLYLYIHGQGGNKEEAAIFSEIVCPKGYQVLSIDLPEHGERKSETGISFDPWHVVPELKCIMSYAKNHWKHISLFANSIGAWFSMLGFSDEVIEQCLFLSPVVDMKALVSKMMMWANVSEAQLQQERIIPTDFGQTLSWEYWTYILEHPITKWVSPTEILYGEKDHLVDRSCVESFSEKFNGNLTVMANGEHWFHTDDQLKFMCEWIKGSTANV